MKNQELHPRTELINKKQKIQAKKARQDALLWLAESFPAAFDNQLLIRPLKLGIMEDILSYADKAALAGISKSKLREAMVVFTRRIDYLTCLKAREMRIDLAGEPVSSVTEEEANHAALKIKKQVEKSTKNAKKLLPQKPGHSHSHKTVQSSSENNISYTPGQYASVTPLGVGGEDKMFVQSARTTSVQVMHKTTRAYDPDAVARLKEKLGLSRQQESAKEPV